MQIKNIIIGSGLSALGFYQNLKNKKDYNIYDKNLYSGGHAASHKYNDIYFDEGAHISHSKNEFFLKRFIINKKNINIITKSNVINFKNNKKIGYPIQSNLSDLEFIEKIYVVKNIITSLFNRRIINNYYDWCNNNYGEYISKYYYKTYTQKYWRTDPEKMSSNWITGRVVKGNKLKMLFNIFKQSINTKIAFNKFYYPKTGGFNSFFADSYKDININYNHKITEIDLNNKILKFNDNQKIKYKNLYSSIPLTEYLNLISNLPKNIEKALKELKYTNLICVNMSINTEINFPYHWCYFYDKQIEISRLSVINNLTGENNSKFNLQAEVFRRNDEKYNVNTIENNVKTFILEFFNINNQTEIEIKSQVIKYAYPIPLLNNEENIKTIKEWLKKSKIFTIGLYGNWQYMWSDQAYSNGKQLAEKINNE